MLYLNKLMLNFKNIKYLILYARKKKQVVEFQFFCGKELSYKALEELISNAEVFFHVNIKLYRAKNKRINTVDNFWELSQWVGARSLSKVEQINNTFYC